MFVFSRGGFYCLKFALVLQIERMTFSDPTTVTLDLDIDLSDPRHRLASHYVITADAIFSDRWGNNTGMFSPIDYVSLQLDKKCSKGWSFVSLQFSFAKPLFTAGDQFFVSHTP